RKAVEVFPFIIGDMVSDFSGLRVSYSSNVRVYPDQLDPFRKINKFRPPNKTQVQRLLTLSEDHVRDAFAVIIGEPFVPKHWGGEKSDLTTTRLSIDGEPISAAFIFKGPSVSGVLHPANLGTRGDQLVRAFDEPVDLIVIQHCNFVANT